MSGKPVAIKVVKKISGKLKFLYRKKKLTPEVRRILCNALIQPHFDYACTAWHTNLTQKNHFAILYFTILFLTSLIAFAILD